MAAAQEKLRQKIAQKRKEREEDEKKEDRGRKSGVKVGKGLPATGRNGKNSKTKEYEAEEGKKLKS